MAASPSSKSPLANIEQKVCNWARIDTIVRAAL